MSISTPNVNCLNNLGDKGGRAEASENEIRNSALRLVQYQLQSSQSPPSESPSNQLHEASGVDKLTSQIMLEIWRCHSNYMSSCNL